MPGPKAEVFCADEVAIKVFFKDDREEIANQWSEQQGWHEPDKAEVAGLWRGVMK